MDGYINEANLWRQACLDDEPIFCAAPSPSNSDDIICLGSDDDTDEAKAAKQRRYEEHGRRYLEGRPLYILSASLRGPFDQTSGWQNPWLPKPSSRHGRGLRHPTRAPLASSPRGYKSGAAFDRLLSEQSNTDETLDDSMECHLPSPQSHEDLKFPEIPSDFKSHTRIASWAKHVEDNILEEDRFWAPGRSPSSAKRHPADIDWLKRRPAKKRKPNGSRSTELTFTPTPLPTSRPRPKSKDESATRSRLVTRSIEMTTPLSSPGKEPRESPGSAERQTVAPNASVGATRAFSEPALQNGQDEEIKSKESEHGHMREYENEEALMAGASETCPGQLHEQTFCSDEENGEIIDFRDCADGSFYYRARCVKQPTPPARSDLAVADCSSVQTETPPLHEGNDTVMVSPNPDTRMSSPNVASSHLDTDNAGYADNPTEPSIAVKPNDEFPIAVAPELELDVGLPKCHEGVFQSRGIIDTNGDTDCAPKAQADGPLSDITSSRHASRLNIRKIIPQSLLKVKAVSSTDAEWVFDEEQTLVGDSINTGELQNLKPTQQDPGHKFDGASLLQHYAISATKLANASQVFQYEDLATLKEMNDTTSCTAAEITGEGVAELQPEQTGRCSQKEGKSDSAVDADTIIRRDDKDIFNLVAEDQTIPAEQQSPWAPLRAVNDSNQLNSGNMERAEDSHRNLTAQAAVVLLDSPTPTHYSPMIRPSQQSPWIKEVAQPINKTRLEESTSSSTDPVVGIASPRELQNPLFLASQEHISWSESSPAVLPVSEKSPQIAREQQCVELDTSTQKEGSPVQNCPCTPIPRIARQSSPDGEVSIRSFSNFNFSSPQQSASHPGSSARRGILSNRKCPSIRTSTKSNKRVSFAPLNHEEEGNFQSPTRPRAASPPPPLVDMEGEDIDGRYQNHFDVMNRSLSVREMPKLQKRLLPSFSQQKPESPSVGAMADAFREADAHLLGHEGDAGEETGVDGVEIGIEVTEDNPQSPWQHNSQGIDDVAAVLGNLSDFLDVWDVDTEMDRSRMELDEAERHEVPSNNDMSILQGVGIW